MIVDEGNREKNKGLSFAFFIQMYFFFSNFASLDQVFYYLQPWGRDTRAVRRTDSPEGFTGQS